MSIDNKDIGCLTLDDFKLWSSRALKVFLSLRGKPTRKWKFLSRKWKQYKINQTHTHTHTHTAYTEREYVCMYIYIYIYINFRTMKNEF